MELLEEAKAADQEVVGLDLALLGADEALEVVVVVHVEDLGYKAGTCSERAVNRRIGRPSMCLDVMNTFFMGSSSPICAK